MTQDNSHGAQHHRMLRKVPLLLTAAIVGFVATIASNMEHFQPKAENDNDSIIIVTPASADFSDKLHHQATLNTKDFGDLAQPIKPADSAGSLPIGSSARQLHDSIMAESKDSNWAGAASRQINLELSSVPYLFGERNLICGTIRCELTVKTDRNISNHNLQIVMNRFYSIENSNDGMGVIVEGVFPTLSADGSTKLNIVYMRH